MEPLLVDEARGLREIDKLCQLLTHGDKRFVDRLAENQLAADRKFQQRGYAVWPSLPKHPLAPGLATYRRCLAGESAISHADQLFPLMAEAVEINAFEADWPGHEAWLAPRLRSPEQYPNTVFEFQVGLHLRTAGYDTEYLAAKRENELGPDFAVHYDSDIDVECVLADPDAGQQVPLLPVMEVAAQVLQYLERRDLYRMVFLRCAEGFAKSDTHRLVAAIRSALAAGVSGTMSAKGDRYEIEVVDGGSTDSPLDRDEAEAAWVRLHETRLRWGTVTIPSDLNGEPLPLYLLRGLNIASAQPDDALTRLVRTAFTKSRQLSGDRPGIIAAGFGRGIAEAQLLLPIVQLGLQRLVMPELRIRPNVSAVVLVFRTEGYRSLLQTVPATDCEPRAATIMWKNDDPAAVPLPASFRWTTAGLT